VALIAMHVTTRLKSVEHNQQSPSSEQRAMRLHSSGEQLRRKVNLILAARFSYVIVTLKENMDLRFSRHLEMSVVMSFG
jgi:hypothetical protein